jgi:hypothetical protein
MITFIFSAKILPMDSNVSLLIKMRWPPVIILIYAKSSGIVSCKFVVFTDAQLYARDDDRFPLFYDTLVTSFLNFI